MAELPTVVTAAGLQPLSPSDLRAMLVALVASTNPGYTSDLPGTLIEDVASTDVGALTLCDQARVELVNSLTPYGANAFLLNQLGQIYGVQPGGPSNTSVDVEFSGPPGFVIAVGFTVSDGTFQYVVQDGGVVESSGSSGELTAVANQTGSFAVPANTVTQLVTSVPSGITLTVTNPLSGVPGAGAETEEQYRARILRAGLAASQGMPRYLRTLLDNVVGVQDRLVSIRQHPVGGWEIIVGGGDEYAVANAIFQAVFDVSTLTGSVMAVTDVTQANPGVVTTDLNHGLTTGTVINITGIIGMVELNSTPLTITVITAKTFSVGVDTTSFPAWISGGVVTPNPRNVVVTLNDYPDTYQIPIVRPPQQSVDIVATWNTTAVNFVASASVAQLGAPALVDYVNALPAGQPINLFQLQEVFQQAVAVVLPSSLLTRLVFTVSIDGIGVPVEAGTGIIAGDPESFLFATAASVQVVQG